MREYLQAQIDKPDIEDAIREARAAGHKGAAVYTVAQQIFQAKKRERIEAGVEHPKFAAPTDQALYVKALREARQSGLHGHAAIHDARLRLNAIREARKEERKAKARAHRGGGR